MFIDYSGVTVPIVNKKTGEIIMKEPYQKLHCGGMIWLFL
jgi:hypothetical protein